MKIRVMLKGVVSRELFSERICTFPNQSTIEEIIHKLHIPKQHVGSVLVNGKHEDHGHCVSNNDTLTFIPIIGGG